jgi:hypothetical protein
VVKVINKNGRKDLLTILAWSDVVDVVDENDFEFYEIKTFKYREVDD